MATLLIFSLLVPLTILFGISVHERGTKFQGKLTVRFLLAGSVLMSLGIYIFAGAVAYYFDFDQHYNPGVMLRLGTGLALIGLFMTLAAFSKMKKHKK